ncbi:MAG TPA: PadR family transcriptional regulator [Longimicrobiales bacterium]
MPRNVIDAVQGTLEFLVLKTLSWGPMHGYAIGRWIFEVTNAELDVEQGTLYPALHRMEDRGWLLSSWQLSDTGRRAKVYRLSAAGRRELAARLADWKRMVAAVDRLLVTAPERG